MLAKLDRSLARFLAILQGIGAPLPFLWTDLSEQDILLLTKNDMTLPLAETLLHKAANHDENTPHLQQAIELDLYKQTLQQAQVSCIAFPAEDQHPNAWVELDVWHMCCRNCTSMASSLQRCSQLSKLFTRQLPANV